MKKIIHPIHSAILPILSEGVPICLYGDAGVGKTTLVEQLAEMLELPFYPMTFTAGMTETALTGNWVLNDKGSMTYAETPFITAVEKGGIFLADEFDAADPNVALCINNILENGMTALPRRHFKPMLKAHPNFRFVACVNTLMNGADLKFTGRNALDAATISRFEGGIFTITPYSEIEQTILPIDSIRNLMMLCRAFAKEYAPQRTISTRTIRRTKIVLLSKICENWEHLLTHMFATWTQEELVALLKFLNNKLDQAEKKQLNKAVENPSTLNNDHTGRTITGYDKENHNKEKSAKFGGENEATNNKEAEEVRAE